MIKILFTRNKLPLSRIICWATGNPVSHVAVCFRDTIVFHSGPMGTHINSYYWFKRNNTIVYEHCLPERCNAEIDGALSAVVEIEGRGYDFGAIIFWGFRLFLFKCFKKPLPKKNLWSSKRFFNCIEVLGHLPDWIWPNCTRPTQRLDAMTPYEVAQYMGAVR